MGAEGLIRKVGCPSFSTWRAEIPSRYAVDTTEMRACSARRTGIMALSSDDSANRAPAREPSKHQWRMVKAAKADQGRKRE